jgi:hypothetical protein
MDRNIPHEGEPVIMTTIEDLARTVADTHGIASIDAARDVVCVHVTEIADDGDLYNPQTRELTDAGTVLVTEAIARCYGNGIYSTYASLLLGMIEAVAAQSGRATQCVELIHAALHTELRRADIAAAAGISEDVLDQIHAGKCPS